MRRELLETENILQLLKKIKKFLDQTENMDDTLIQEMLDDIEAVNTEVYGCKEYPGIFLHRYADDPVLFTRQFERWQNLLSEELQRRKSIFNKTDYDFHVLSAHILITSEETLLEETVDCLRKIRQDSGENYERIKRAYNYFHYFWGSLDLDNGNLGLLENRIHEIKSHWDDFCWLYDNLADYRSKKALYGILRHWMTFDFQVINSVRENNYDDYYDFDIIKCSEDEVFVDLGEYEGESALSYINNFGAYKRIYCYEMTAASMEKMKKNLADFDNIVYRQAAVGNTNGVVDIFGDKIMPQGSGAFMPHEAVQVPMVRLDDDIREPITFLKMDIEGSELEAMKGAEQHIRKDKPKLAVCAYHNNRHIYEIPRLMKEYNPQYKLYMRYNGPAWQPWISEYVIFAIPDCL